MKKLPEIGLSVQHPTLGCNCLLVGFKSKEQAWAFGQFRNKLRKTVRNPRVIINPKHENYQQCAVVTKKQIKKEILSFFEL